MTDRSRPPMPSAQLDLQRTTKMQAGRRASTAALALAAGATLLAGCTTVVRPARATRVVVDMPPPVREVRPPPPQPSWQWVPGHYVWRGNAWEWVPGHYVAQAVPPMPPPVDEPVVVAPSPTHVWVRGHWVWRNGWVWSPGHWAMR
jgi:hypothetical protein